MRMSLACMMHVSACSAVKSLRQTLSPSSHHSDLQCTCSGTDCGGLLLTEHAEY